MGIAHVIFNQAGDPRAVERLGIALEPEAAYERRSDGGGGCEDPRITFVEPLRRYVMTYAALSSIGSRIAFAMSDDLFHWTRLGLATFAPLHGIDFVHVDNKDASLFPAPQLFMIGRLCGGPGREQTHDRDAKHGYQTNTASGNAHRVCRSYARYFRGSTDGDHDHSNLRGNRHGVQSRRRT
jgi:hypothetical protein